MKLSPSQKAKDALIWSAARVGLANGRQQRDATRKLIARGGDVAEQIKLGPIAASVAFASSFDAVAAEWLTDVDHCGADDIPERRSGLFRDRRL